MRDQTSNIAKNVLKDAKLNKPAPLVVAALNGESDIAIAAAVAKKLSASGKERVTFAEIRKLRTEMFEAPK